MIARQTQREAARRPQTGVDRWVKEQMFEEDLRAVIRMIRPHQRERLMGWNEYRTGGAHFRATVSWDEDFEEHKADQPLNVPHMAEVLESLLIGSARSECELTAEQEFGLYRDVVLELLRRLEEAKASCE